MATLDEMRRSLIAAHNSGDTITARKLALSIKLMESQPMGAVPVAQPLGYRSQAVRRPLTMGERVQEFGAGVGRGLETQLGGIRAIGERFSQLQQESAEQPGSPLQAMVFRPAAQLGREFLAGIEPYVRDPGKIVEAWQEMASRAASGPQQAGQVFGEMVDPRGLMAALKTPPVAEMTTYHGTPHVFAPEEGAPLGRFRASQIGTGEGAQAYGHGIYVAENPNVAGEYRQSAGPLSWDVGGGFEVPQAARVKLEQWVNSFKDKGSDADSGRRDIAYAFMYEDGGPSPDQLRKKLDDDLRRGTISDQEYQGGIDALNESAKIFDQTRGSLYTVDLPDPMVERMLDWDKPLSEQPANVRKYFEPLVRERKKIAAQTGSEEWGDLSVPYNYDPSGRELMQILGAGEMSATNVLSAGTGGPAASVALQKAGIPGVRYLDAGSRDSAKGTRNFVIFPGEEQNLTILERDGKPAAPPVVSPARYSSVADLENALQSQNIRADISENKGLITLHAIVVPKEMRSGGIGSKAMQDLIDYADQTGQRIALSPSTDFGATSRGRLVDFYKRFGFVENKGRNKDFRVSESMIREPKK